LDRFSINLNLKLDLNPAGRQAGSTSTSTSITMKNTLITLLLLTAFFTQAQVGIGVSTSTMAASAQLEVASTTKGFLPPRITLTGTEDVATISSPATGLFIYNTATAGATPNNVSPGLYYYDGSKWQRVINQLSGYATTSALATKADVASPTFTGTPTLPTGTIGVTQTAENSTTALATTAFVATANATNANLTGMVTSNGNATTVVTNANLTGVITSSGNATSLGSFTSTNLASALSDETGTGVAVLATSPSLVTPVLGVATATSINSTSIPSSKTLVVTTDKLSAMAATTSSELAGVISDETGTGTVVLSVSPTFTGTPTLPTGTIGVTQTAGNSTTAIATTAFVTGAISSAATGSNYVDLTNAQTVAGTKSFSSSMAVGTAVVPVSSAALEVASTTKGFLPPRMTTPQRNAIVSPENGLIIFNTITNSVNVFFLGQWNQINTSLPQGSIASLIVSSPTNNGTLINGVVASSISSVVSYTGGNGEIQNGQSVASTGVSGLTATLNSANLEVGNGTLTYIIIGTPTSFGTASFALSIGGQTATLTRTVVAQGSITSLNVSSPTNNGILTNGITASGVSSVVSYTGGNGGILIGQSLASTGVTGLTATLDSGYFAVGSGTLTYTITGTPTSDGTANFAMNIGGQTATLTRTVAPFAIGQDYQGGKIFYIDGTGLHGLIAPTSDQQIPITSGVSFATAESLCSSYNGGGYSDWRLPSKDELNSLYLNKTTIGGFRSNYYFSSTVPAPGYWWVQNFSNGSQGTGFSTYFVRAIRAF
jgi:hypothetical protein